MNKYLTVNAAKNETEENEILVHGPIGVSFWDDDGISGKDFTNALNKFPRGTKFTIGVNSQGGAVGEGLAIFNAIQRRSEDVTVRIDGYAISIASVFPLAAGKVISPKSSIWMIHNAWAWAAGNAEEMRKQADVLDTHDETIVGIYAEKTGKSEKEIKDAMAAETWFNGDEAVSWGLADEVTTDETEEAQNKLDFSKAPQAAFKNIPSSFMAMASFKNLPAARGAGTKQNNQNSEPADSLGVEQTMKKENIVALLKTHGIEASIDETIEALEAKLTQALAKNPAPKPVAKDDDSEVKAELKRIKEQLETERVNRVTRAMDQLVVENKLTVDECKAWLPKAILDETIVAELGKRQPAFDGTDPIGAAFAAVVSGTPREEIAKLAPAARAAKLRTDWDALWADAQARGKRNGGVFAANTYPAGLITDYLSSNFIVTLQHRLAMLSAFSLTVGLDPVKPKAVVQVGKAISATATGTDITDFEPDDATVLGAITATAHQYTQSFHVTNAELQSGLEMSKLVDVNAAAFADKIITVVNALITTGNFTTNEAITTAFAAFGLSDLAQAWGLLQKSPIKNAVLNGQYMARILNTPGMFQAAGTEGGTAWAKFGWDRIESNSNWTGATAGVNGIACNPQAILCLSALPLTTPVSQGVLQQSTIAVNGLGINAQQNMWFSLASRTIRASYDIMFAAALGDETAGVLIKNQ